MRALQMVPNFASQKAVNNPGGRASEHMGPGDFLVYS